MEETYNRPWGVGWGDRNKEREAGMGDRLWTPERWRRRCALRRFVEGILYGEWEIPPLTPRNFLIVMAIFAPIGFLVGRFV